jgi:ribosomal protein S18 acetylase RimI-like enzyme
VTTPVAVAIRRADANDLISLSNAHRLGQAAVTDARGGRLDTLLKGRAEPIEQSFANELSNGHTTVLVGTANDAFTGYCVATQQTLRSGESIMVISDLWVHPEARGIGVGSALMHEVLDVAKQLGCSGIDARALPGDRATKNFFESFGLVARTIEVHKALS